MDDLIRKAMWSGFFATSGILKKLILDMFHDLHLPIFLNPFSTSGTMIWCYQHVGGTAPGSTDFSISLKNRRRSAVARYCQRPGCDMEGQICEVLPSSSVPTSQWRSLMADLVQFDAVCFGLFAFVRLFQIFLTSFAMQCFSASQPFPCHSSQVCCSPVENEGSAPPWWWQLEGFDDFRKDFRRLRCEPVHPKAGTTSSERRAGSVGAN